METELSLLDVFMPNDLCARCDEEEAVKDFRLLVKRADSPERHALLSFCTESCKGRFVRGAAAVKELPDVW